MGYKVKDEQVVKMSKIHTNTFVADRLGISTRQVSRILAKNDASKKDPKKRKSSMPQDVETWLMGYWRDVFGDSYQEIGELHGLSRQAVHQRLVENVQ